jgi:Flp pilus assembly protein TadB
MSLHAEPEPPAAGADPAIALTRSAQRRQRRRRRALRRLDILIGLVVGAIWLLVAPGIALAGIVAVVVLLIAGASWLLGRRRRRRRLMASTPERRRRRPAR